MSVNCYTRSMKYGSFVFLLAHEIFHAFDSKSINDDEGNIKNNYNLTNESLKSFNKNAECFMDSFHISVNNETKVSI